MKRLLRILATSISMAALLCLGFIYVAPSLFMEANVLVGVPLTILLGIGIGGFLAFTFSPKVSGIAEEPVEKTKNSINAKSRSNTTFVEVLAGAVSGGVAAGVVVFYVFQVIAGGHFTDYFYAFKSNDPNAMQQFQTKLAVEKKEESMAKQAEKALSAKGIKGTYLLPVLASDDHAFVFSYKNGSHTSLVVMNELTGSMQKFDTLHDLWAINKTPSDEPAETSQTDFSELSINVTDTPFLEIYKNGVYEAKFFYENDALVVYLHKKSQ